MSANKGGIRQNKKEVVRKDVVVLRNSDPIKLDVMEEKLKALPSVSDSDSHESYLLARLKQKDESIRALKLVIKNLTAALGGIIAEVDA